MGKEGKRHASHDAAISDFVCIFSLFGARGELLALERSDILFYAPFDGTLDAQISKGSPKPARAEGKIQFVEGRAGQGLLTGGPGGVWYSTEGNVDLDAGAIAIWVKPVELENGRIHAAFRLSGGRGGRGGFRVAVQDPWIIRVLARATGAPSSNGAFDQACHRRRRRQGFLRMGKGNVGPSPGDLVRQSTVPVRQREVLQRCLCPRRPPNAEVGADILGRRPELAHGRHAGYGSE